MGIARKFRRHITVCGRRFLWWVAPDCDDFVPTLNIASDDRRFLVRFPFAHDLARRLLIVIGPEFPGLPDAGGCQLRVRCPDPRVGSEVRPAGVRRLIEWCLSPAKRVERVDWRGDDVPASEGEFRPKKR